MIARVIKSRGDVMSSIEKYGYFDREEGCFVLTAEPPKKWVNLHCNKVGDDEMYAEITNIGDGPIWVRDKDGCRCDLVSYDSKFLYIRDDRSGKVFCPWGAPAPQPVEDRECRYYPARTEISSRCEGLKVTQRVFVPREHIAEVWTLKVDNETAAERELSVFAYAMFQLTGCDAEGNGVWKENIAEVRPEIGGVYIYNRRPDLPHDRYKGYLITVNKEFYNGNGYRDHFTRSEFALGTPKILWGWDCDGKPGYGSDCAGVVQVKIKVPANGSARVDFLIGQTGSPAEVKALRDELTPEKLDAMCEEQCAIESANQKKFTVDTGHKNIDGLINTFVKKQIYCYTINKSGFRDNLQNDCALSLFDFETAKANLLRALSSQYLNGSVPHGFRPLNRLQYSDKPAWIFLTVPALIKESGDFSLLDMPVPYFESAETGTVLDHMVRAMRFLAGDLGANGLCDQHHADWNDGLEATKEAGDRESVMVTMQFCYGMREFADLAKRAGKDEIAEEAENNYAIFKERLNNIAWDGEWYVRTICGDGYRIGSSANKEGKIFVNPQSWAVLSGIAPADRAEKAMQSVDKMIETDMGFRICFPGFSQYDPRVGRMSEAIPDHIENGGCYNHAAGFKGVADCVLGRAEEAWRTFLKVAPDSPWNPVSRSETEPFSFTNSYSMCPIIYGKSGYPWRTGTAAWFTVLLVEWILGARRDYDGLLIDPCLAKEIRHAEVTRTFRGTTFKIYLDNRAGRCTGVSEITVDGEKIKGKILDCLDGKTHDVKVVI